MSSTETAPSITEATPAWAVEVKPSLPDCADCLKADPKDGKRIIGMGFHKIGEDNLCPDHYYLRTRDIVDPYAIKSSKTYSMDQLKGFILRPNAAKDAQNKLDAAADELVKVTQAAMLETDMPQNSLDTAYILMQNVSPELKPRIAKAFFEEVRSRVKAEKIAFLDEEKRVKDTAIRSFKKALLDSAVHQINANKPEIAQARIEHIQDMKLLEKVGKNLDFLAATMYEQDRTLHLFVKQPESKGCSQCGNAAHQLAERVESRRPKPPPFTPPAVDSSQKRKAKVLWMGGASGVEPEE